MPTTVRVQPRLTLQVRVELLDGPYSIAHLENEGWAQLEDAHEEIAWEFSSVPDGYRPSVRFLAYVPKRDGQDPPTEDFKHPFRTIERDGDEHRVVARQRDRGAPRGFYWFKTRLEPKDGGDSIDLYCQPRVRPYYAGGVDTSGPVGGMNQ